MATRRKAREHRPVTRSRARSRTARVAEVKARRRRRRRLVSAAAAILAAATVAAWWIVGWSTATDTGLLAYVAGDEQGRKVMLAELDGTDRRPISPEELDAFGPAWAHGGQAIAYITNQSDASSFAIHVHDLESHHDRVLLDTDDVIAALAWSPDGATMLIDRIVAADGADEFEHRLERVSERNGRTESVLRTSREGFGQISWRDHPYSPIAVAEQTGGQSEILILGADGTVRRRLEGSSPAWSPDGERLAYVRETVDGWELVVSDETGGREQVRFGSDRVIFKPTWRPDAGLVFERYEAGSTSPSIWEVDADGTDLRRVIGTQAFTGFPTIATEA